jgi:hypothetical protein
VIVGPEAIGNNQILASRKTKGKKKKAGEDELTEGMPGMMSAPFLVFPYDPIIE